MPSAREDYLLRLIQQLGAVLRRLRARLREGTEAGAVLSAQEIAQMDREAGEAIAELLGPQAALLQHVDSTSAVSLVGGADRVALWIELLEVQADAARAAGEDARATRQAARVSALRAAAAARWPDEPATA